MIDIAAAKQALTKTSNRDVNAFAEDMVHWIWSRSSRSRPKNDTNRTLSKNAADKLAELGKLKGAEFGKAYIANEVAYHKVVARLRPN